MHQQQQLRLHHATAALPSTVTTGSHPSLTTLALLYAPTTASAVVPGPAGSLLAVRDSSCNYTTPLTAHADGTLL